MPSSHLILCRPLLLLPPIPPSIRVFSNESTPRMRWPNYWSFSFSISPSNEHPGLISFRMDWLDLLTEIQLVIRAMEIASYTNVMRSTHKHSKSSLSLNHSFIPPLAFSEMFNGPLLFILLNSKFSAWHHSPSHLPSIIKASSRMPSSLFHTQFHLQVRGDSPAILSLLLPWLSW